jgi:hypothetical protein
MQRSMLLTLVAFAALVLVAGPVPVGWSSAARPPALATAPPAPERPSPQADPSTVRFTIGEGPLLEWLRAVTPWTLTVGNQLLSTELVFSDPSDLRLKDGLASLRIHARGKTLPIDQTLEPVISLGYDRGANRYYGSLASLPLELPGLGKVDLKDSVPRFELPTVLENLWRFSDRPLGLNLKIRRIAILDHVLEVGTDITFAPTLPSAARSTR